MAWSLGFVVVGVGACRVWLPARYVVNVPLANALFGRTANVLSAPTLREKLRTPPGFTLTRYAEGLPNARLLRFTETGHLLVSLPRSGRVMILERDANGDGRPDSIRPVLEGVNRPHGLDLKDGYLYVAESDAIGRIRFDTASGRTEGRFERIVTGLPSGGNHWTRTLRFGPDGLLYVSIGSSCNACVEKDPRRAAMNRYRPDGTGAEIFATGLRNAVGFDFHPKTAALFATDNGRDLLGDDVPPCELNHVAKGSFYGWPFAYGDRIPDPDYGKGHEPEIAGSIPPVHAFRAHNAPLGIAFIRGDRVPPEYRGAALVALHGSWNRTRKDGYKVVSLHWEEGGRIIERDFLWGFLDNERVLGRPVDVTEGPDAAFYVSDDYTGSIYRVAFGEARPDPTVDASAPTPGAKDVALLGAAELSIRSRRGRAAYERLECAGCHEKHGSSGKPAKALEGLDQRYTVSALEEYLAAPQPPMPFVDLPGEERRDLATYLLARDRAVLGAER